VQADYAYRNGSPIVIVGNIGVHQEANMVLALKIGVKDLDVPNAPFTRPYFPYLQPLTTARSRHETLDGDEGFRLIVVGLSEASNKLLLEMLDTGEVTIGFNRNKNNIDVLVPIDLKVFDAEPLPPQSFRRKRSDNAITQFSGFCQAFFSWYNGEHRHSGIGLMTPAAVHDGRASAMRDARQRVLLSAYAVVIAT
jgi:hypothetical protein